MEALEKRYDCICKFGSQQEIIENTKPHKAFCLKHNGIEYDCICELLDGVGTSHEDFCLHYNDPITPTYPQAQKVESTKPVEQKKKYDCFCKGPYDQKDAPCKSWCRNYNADKHEVIYESKSKSRNFWDDDEYVPYTYSPQTYKYKPYVEKKKANDLGLSSIINDEIEKLNKDKGK